MKAGPDISIVGALIGDPARANMLTALAGGVAMTATELATEAGVTQQTASSHLAKLLDGGLLALRKQGRHRYFQLANEQTAAMIEGIMGLAHHAGHRRTQPGPKEPALREARVCYDHLAGERGVALFDSLIRRNALSAAADGLALTPAGEQFMCDFGVDVEAGRKSRRPLCLACLDWSSRRNHLAGALGAALLQTIQDKGWARREKGTRIVRFSPPGARAFDKLVGERI